MAGLTIRLAIPEQWRIVAPKDSVMKKILPLLVLGFAGVAAGQDTITFTNKLITFTNLQGKVFRDVRLVRADLDGIIYRETVGVGGGRVCYTNLSLGLLESLDIPTNRIAVAKARADHQAADDAARSEERRVG